jgi:hypothetical protein
MNQFLQGPGVSHCHCEVKDHNMSVNSNPTSSQLTPVINLYIQISPRIFVKIRKGPNWILRGQRKLIHEKNLKSKISCQAPLKRSVTTK